MNNLDYSLLKGRIVLFVCVLVVSILLLWFGFSQLSKQQQMINSTQSGTDYTAKEIAQLNNLVSLFENFNTDYKKYKKKGFLGEEQRLSWIETLENTANSLGLDDLRYQISPRQQLSNETHAHPSNINVFKSKLTFESGLVHEGDLLDIINNLNKLNSGLFIIDSCKIDRTAEELEAASNSNFQASCSTSWYTATYHEKTTDLMEDEI